MRSWKTTLCGAVSSAASFVLALSAANVVPPKWVSVAAAFVLSGGIAGLGIVGKDSNVTGASSSPNGDRATK